MVITYEIRQEVEIENWVMEKELASISLVTNDTKKNMGGFTEEHMV